MPRSTAHDRDLGIRKISSTTRILAGAGVVFVGAFSAFLASRAPSHASTTANSVPSQVQPGVDEESGVSPSVVPNDPVANVPIPQAHTRSRGS